MYDVLPNITELQVMRSAAGYYLGHGYYDAEAGGELPYSRESEYFSTREEAEKELAYWKQLDADFPL